VLIVPDEDFEVFRNFLRKSPIRPHGGDAYYIPLGKMKERMSEGAGSEDLEDNRAVSIGSE
jgi:hypothetical protein